jgi:DNA modification methylase
MVAAEQLGRICYGIEIEPKYVAVALQRMTDMGLEPRLTK